MATYFGRSVLASPAHLNALSGSPAGVTQGGPWSRPMNQMSGFACAAQFVAWPLLKPAVTIMSKFWSTKPWMFLASSEASFGTTTGGSAAPSAVAPALAPLLVYSLKFLSLTVPTSVETPIFHFVLSVGNECVPPL